MPLLNGHSERIIDGLDLIRLLFWFPDFWSDACSISAIGESNGKSKLAKYFQNSYALERYKRVERGGGLKFHDN